VVSLADPTGAISTVAKVDLKEITTAGQGSVIYQQVANTTTASLASIWARTVSGTGTLWIGIDNGEWTHSTFAAFDLTTEWKRIVTPVTTRADGFLYFIIGPNTIDPGTGQPSVQPALSVYLWGGQIEVGSLFSPYIPTTTAAVTATGNVVAMKGHAKNLEFAEATNKCLHSEDIGNGGTGWTSPWATSYVYVGAPTSYPVSMINPMGITSTVTRFDFPEVTRGDDYTIVYQEYTSTAAPWTISFWARSVTGTCILYASDDVGNGSSPQITCNLTTTWQRFTQTVQTTAATWDIQFGKVYGPTPAMSCYIWGVQIEQCAAATPYIPTTTAAVTQAVGRLDIMRPEDWVVGFKVTCDAALNHLGGGTRFLFHNGPPAGTDADERILDFTNAGDIQFSVFDNAGVVKYINYSTPIPAGEHTLVCVNSHGNVVLYLDGVSVGAVTGTGSGIVSAQYPLIYLGGAYITGYQFNGSISKFVQGHSVREVAYELSKP